MRRALLISCLVLRFACLASSAGAADVYTEHDYRKAMLEFNLRTMVQAYKEVGKHDPRWDDDAIKLLDGMARYFTYDNAERWYAGESPKLKDLESAAKKAISAGCNDPLVLYCYGGILDRLSKDRDAIPYLRKGTEGLMQSGYPTYRAMAAAQRLFDHLDAEKERDAFIQARDLVTDTIAATVSVAAPKGVDRRIILGGFLNDLEKLDPEQQQQILEKAEKASADAWMLNMIAGQVHLNAAWKARGSGWADTVTEEGWKGFADHLAQARTHYEKAQQIQPDYPEAATCMITVSMGDSTHEERAWFDRAVAAQVDYEPAYRKLRWALRPRWGGSYGDMLALALEAGASKRFDTRVPFQAIDIIFDIVDDEAGSLNVWRDEKVAAMATEVLNGCVQVTKDQKLVSYYRSLLACIHWSRHESAAAREILDQEKGELDPSATREFHLANWRLADQVYAFSSEWGTDLAQAEERATKDPASAQSTFAAIYKKLPSGDKGRRFVRCRMQELTWLKGFVAGETVSLQPTAATKLSGWEAYRGHWTHEKDGSVSGTSTGSGMILLNNADFGPRFELTGTVEIDSQDGDKEANGGPIIGWWDHNNYYGMWLRRKSQQVVMRRSNKYTQAWPAEVKDRNDFVIQVWDNYASASINGTPAFSEYQLRDFVVNRSTRIGIGSQFASDRSTVRFKDLKIKCLDQQPASITTQPATRPSMMRSKRLAEAK
ncbi:MAG TPA: hypothetical protein VF669_10240 [Tepidisphaeraceae bacterium]|jgi:hypothetical protein